RDKWPLGRGFERFYGFLGGETDQYFPELVRDNSPVPVPRTPEAGYHLTEDITDEAIGYLADLRGSNQERPFFMWFAPGACHAPHQAPQSYIDAYRGHFDQGWDAWREQVFARQVASGLLPDGTQLSERPSWVPEWSTLSDDERRLAGRMMEVYAGFLTHTDAQVGRLLDYVDQLDEADNTIVIVMSDNGASAEGGRGGSFNELYFFNFIPENLAENLARIDELGGPHANNHYPWGWAWAGNTPLKRFKRDTHEGGVADPLIVSWPTGIAAPGRTQRQYVHAIDLMPTLLEVIGIDAPGTIAGVPQTPIEGTSFAATLADPAAADLHTTQYYEMLGSRALYHDGWKAVAFNPPQLANYEGTSSSDVEAVAWELYHVAEDFSECTDLAATHPDKLAELQEIWWREAERFSVLPLNNSPGMYGDGRYKRDAYRYSGHVGPLTESLAPNLKNREWTIEADLALASAAERGASTNGVIAAHGSHAGGWVFFVHERRLHFTYNFVDTERFAVTSEVELPTSDVTVRANFVRTPDGRGGTVELSFGGVPVGEASVRVTTPMTYGTPGFTVGFLSSSPIDKRLHGRSEFDPTVLREVRFELRGTDFIRDTMAPADDDGYRATDSARWRVDLATQ
ncbi:MAG: sulfatase-like hydrolase/transferase, partial [Actinobacteria bacterium]|nr:sulfatase-like hydrolase/transferase [Actinomycetota bacterium]